MEATRERKGVPVSSECNSRAAARDHCGDSRERAEDAMSMAFGITVEAMLGRPTVRIRVPGFEPWLCSQSQLLVPTP